MNYTSIEQSEKLLELGLKPESADMFYEILTGEIYPQLVRVKLTDKHWMELYPEVMMPCWSLGALLEMMPKEGIQPFEDSNPFIGYGDKKYRCVYLNGDWESSHQTMGDTPIEAAYNMIVWLLENGHIKKQ